MDIQEIRQKKHQLEEELLKLIQDFERETTLRLDHIAIYDALVPVNPNITVVAVKEGEKVTMTYRTIHLVVEIAQESLGYADL